MGFVLNGGGNMTNKSGVIFGVIGYIFFFFCMEGWGVDWKFFGSQESESKKFFRC
jgi:hypothetical protein